MTNLREINFFRLIVFVGLSVLTSSVTFFADESLTRGEIFMTLLQALVVMFSFLQCPEAANFLRKPKEKNNE